jgi:hypothetical protein
MGPCGIAACPPMPQAPARPGWGPAMTGRVLRPPRARPPGEQTTAPSRHGGQPSSARHPSPLLGLARRRPSSDVPLAVGHLGRRHASLPRTPLGCSPIAARAPLSMSVRGGEAAERVGQRSYTVRTSRACLVAQLVGHRPWGMPAAGRRGRHGRGGRSTSAGDHTPRAVSGSCAAPSARPTPRAGGLSPQGRSPNGRPRAPPPQGHVVLREPGGASRAACARTCAPHGAVRTELAAQPCGRRPPRREGFRAGS